MVSWNFIFYGMKNLKTLYTSVKWFFNYFCNFGDIWSSVSKNEQNFEKLTKIDIFYNIAPKYVSMKMVIGTNLLPSASSPNTLRGYLNTPVVLDKNTF